MVRLLEQWETTTVRIRTKTDSTAESAGRTTRRLYSTCVQKQTLTEGSGTQRADSGTAKYFTSGKGSQITTRVVVAENEAV